MWAGEEGVEAGCVELVINLIDIFMSGKMLDHLLEEKCYSQKLDKVDARKILRC